MEIYNEALYDLLSDNPAASEGLAIMEDNNGNTQVDIGSSQIEDKALNITCWEFVKQLT